MTQEFVPPVPEVPVSDAATETPEVVEQETQQEPQETVEERVARLEKESHGKQRRIDRVTADKYRLQGEIQARERALEAERQKIAQYEQALGIRQQKAQEPQDIERIVQERVQLVERELSAIKTIEGLQKESPKFVDNLEMLNKGVVPLLDSRGLPSLILDEILDCSKPAKVVEHLVKNPEIAAELEGLSPTKLARKLAAIEHEISQPKQTKVSEAPKPLSTVRSSAGSAEPPMTDTYAWIKWKNAQEIARRR